MALTYNQPATSSIPSFAQRDDIILVESSSDLPALVGGNYPLDGTLMYQIKGNVAVNNSFDIGGSRIEGRLWKQDKVTHSTVPFLTDGDSGIVRNLTVDGAFFGGVFNMVAKSASNELVFENVRFENAGGMGRISGYSNVTFINCDFSSVGSFTIEGCSNAQLVDCRFFGNIAPVVFEDSFESVILKGCYFSGTNSSSYVRFSGTGTVKTAYIEATMLNLSAGKTGLDGGSGGTLTIGDCRYNISFDNQGGTNTANVAGWTGL